MDDHLSVCHTQQQGCGFVSSSLSQKRDCDLPSRRAIIADHYMVVDDSNRKQQLIGPRKAYKFARYSDSAAEWSIDRSVAY